MESLVTRNLPDFTPRESDVLYLLAQAYTRKKICNELNIRERTVHSHMYSISKKAGLHSHVELIAFAQVNGYGKIEE